MKKMAVDPGVFARRAWCAVYLYAFCTLTHSSTQGLTEPPCPAVRFSVIGPDQPIVVPPGGDAALPCYLAPKINAEDMSIRWFKTIFSAIVHSYHSKVDWDGQMAEYRGRTEFIKSNIRTGSVSLIIRRVRPSDSGKYNCFFSVGDIYEEAIIELKVAALGTDPHIRIEEDATTGLARVVLRSDGWFPEPEVQCKDSRGEEVTTLPEVMVPDASGYTDVRITYLVQGYSDRQVTCSIRNSAVNVQREWTVDISDSLLQRVSRCGVSRILILASFAVLLIFFIPLAIYLFKKHSIESGRLAAELEWRRARCHEVDVTLDPDTAYPGLVLSPDHKAVSHGMSRQELPDNEERFDLRPCVLGTARLTRGRYYWEVAVEGASCWELGVCDHDRSRKGGNTMCLEEGCWRIRSWGPSGYLVYTFPAWTRLAPTALPRTVGVFVDSEAETVSFYNVEARSRLFSYGQCAFPSILRPYFCIWEGDQPLRIHPVTG